MNGHGRRGRLLGAILLITLIAIVGIGAYRMGVAQGLALGMAQVESGREAVAPHAWHAHGWYGWPGPWGFGFGGFGFLVPLLFIFVWVAALKTIFWRGPRGPWRGGPWHRHYHHRRRRRDVEWDDDDWRRRGTVV